MFKCYEKFYEGTSYVDYDEFERMVKEDADLGYEVFIVDTFPKSNTTENIMPMITTIPMKLWQNIML